MTLDFKKIHTVTSDIDGTLADIDDALIAKYAAVFKVSKAKAHHELFIKSNYESRGPFIDDYCMNDPQFWLNLKPYSMNVASLINFRVNKFDESRRLYFVTARPESLRPQTEQWIDDHFGILGYDGILMDTNKRKDDACSYLGADIHFDDRWAEAKRVANKDIPVGIIRMPYNRKYERNKKGKGLPIYWINHIKDIGGPFKI